MARTTIKESSFYCALGLATFGYRQLQEVLNAALAKDASKAATYIKLEMVRVAVAAHVQSDVTDIARDTYRELRALGDDAMALDVVLELGDAHVLCGELDEARILLSESGILGVDESLSPRFRRLRYVLEAHSKGKCPNFDDDDGADVQLLNHFARLCYLGQQFEQGERLLRIAIQRTTSDDERTELEWNLLVSESRIVGGDSHARHTDLNDRSQISSADLFRTKRRLRALEACVAGEENDLARSLSLAWIEVRETNASLSWQDHENSRRLLARQWMKLGGQVQAVVHAVQSRDEKVCVELGEAIVQARDAEDAERAAALATSSRLGLHFPFAALILTAIAPLLNKRSLELTFDFAIERADTDLILSGTYDLARPAWRLLRALSKYVGEDKRKVLTSKIASCSLASLNPLVIHEILLAIGAMVDSLSPIEAQELSMVVLDVVDRRDPYTYEDAVRLVVELSDRLDPEEKSRIGNLLIPPRRPVDAVRMQHVRSFGRQIATSTEAERVASNVIKELRLTFQRVAAGTDAKRPSSMSMHVEFAEGDLITHAYQINHTILNMCFVVYPRLSRPKRQMLVNALLSLAVEPENLYSNRRHIMLTLRALIEQDPKVRFSTAFNKLLPLAEGQLLSERQLEEARQSQNPLSSFKLNIGDPERLKIYALPIVTVLSSRQSGSKSRRILQLIDRFVTSHDHLEREAGVEAIGLLTSISYVHFVQLVTSLYTASDPLFTTAARTLSYRVNSLDSQQSLLLVGAVEDILASRDISRQVWGVKLASVWRDQVPEPAASRFANILYQASRDVDIRVRNMTVTTS